MRLMVWVQEQNPECYILCMYVCMFIDLFMLKLKEFIFLEAKGCWLTVVHANS